MKLATAKDCRDLVLDSSLSTPIHGSTRAAIANIQRMLGGAPEVVLLDWTGALKRPHVIISIDDAGNEEYGDSFLRRLFSNEPKLRQRERMRLMQFRAKTLVGLPRAVSTPPSKEYGLLDVAWYDVVDRETGNFLEFDAVIDVLSRRGRVVPIDYRMRGPFTYENVSTAFEQNPAMTTFRVRPMMPQYGSDGRRLEFILTRAGEGLDLG